MTAHRIILDLEKRLERQENLHAEASLALDVLQHDKKISQLIHGETRKKANEKRTSFHQRRGKNRDRNTYHEERVGGLDEALLLVLELLELRRGVEQVDVVLEHLRNESIA